MTLPPDYDRALFALCVLPTCSELDEIILVDTLKAIYGEDVIQCDTHPSWWNLNQNWYEFHDAAYTDWNAVKPFNMTPHEFAILGTLLMAGKVVMTVHRYDHEGKLQPHC